MLVRLQSAIRPQRTGTANGRVQDVTPEFVVRAGHLLAGIVLAIAVLTAYRYVRRQSPIVAALMALGILGRAAIGVSLFWISYLDLTFLRGLHTGDGFWALAPDAGTYYLAAIRAYFDGMSAITAQTPSPAFVQMLAAWMYLVGPGQVSGLYLNVCLYALLCVLVVKICQPGERRDAQLACAACLAPFSVAPVLLIHGSQPLKDEAFVFLIALACLSVMMLLRVSKFDLRHETHVWSTAAALTGLGIATFLITGIRWYYAFLVLACLAPATVVYVWRARSSRPVRAAAIALAGIAAAAVGPAYIASQGDTLTSALAWIRPTPAAPVRISSAPKRPSGGIAIRRVLASGVDESVARLQWARYRFALTGGGSNVASAGPESPIRVTMVGLALVLVPISIVKGLGWVDFPGGRGLLAVTDIDTVLLDLSILACAILLFVRRESLGPNAAYLCYGVLLALVTGLLLSFVVTKFGTLFRLRLLMAAPLWMLPLAACYRTEEETAIVDAPAATHIAPAVMPRPA